MRKIELSLETAIRWYNGTDAELKALSVQTYPELGKKELPKSWKDAKRYTNTAEEKFVAMARLEILRDIYNDGWVADWEDRTQNKYVIEFSKNKLFFDKLNNSNKFLAFKDAETRDLFLENFEDLILTAKPLLG